MMELFLKGGPVMVLLAVCSLLGVYIIVQKLLFFRVNLITRTQLAAVKQTIAAHGKQAAVNELTQKHDTVSRLIASAITVSVQSLDEARERLSELAVRELPKYEKNLRLIMM